MHKAVDSSVIFWYSSSWYAGNIFYNPCPTQNLFEQKATRSDWADIAMAGCIYLLPHPGAVSLFVSVVTATLMRNTFMWATPCHQILSSPFPPRISFWEWVTIIETTVTYTELRDLCIIWFWIQVFWGS